MLCSYFNFKTGGLEKHVYYLTRGLIKHGIKVTLVTAYRDPYTNATIPPYKGDNLTIIPLRYCIAPLNNPLLYGLPRVLSKINPDVIHVHDHYFYGSMISSLLKRIIKKPLVLTIHTSKLHYDDFLKNTMVDLYDVLVGKTMFIIADKIIVLSRKTKHELLSLRIPKNKIELIPNFLPEHLLEDYDAKIYNTVKEWGKFKVLFVGRLVPRKGPHILLSAFETALRNGLLPKDSKLMIVGKGPLEEYLRKIVSTNSELREKVIFWGAVRDDVLGALYRASDVVVLPSLSGEVAPFVIQEAIALEKPFIASIVGGIWDYITEKYWGFYIPPGDVIMLANSLGKLYALLTEKPGLVREMVRNNKEKLLNACSEPYIVLKTIGVYLDAIRNNIRSNKE
ncbi:MAG: glycosyltransferase family 4 protein [Desulfurococcaceae archaeon]